ncbi:MAG TPA: DUF559 domain-containing protein [Pseudonocardia sp.]
MTEPFRGTEALKAGRLTRAQLYGTRFRRVYPDVYVPADAEPDFAALSRAAYLLVQDRGGVLAGYSAAILLGADCAPRNAPAEVLVATNSRAHAGLLVHRGRCEGTDVHVARGVRMTSARRTAWDLARRLPLEDAVVVVDSLARVGRFEPDHLLERRAEQPGARGVLGLAEVVALADPRAESPPETRLRLLLHRAGLPAPEVQYRIEDEYGFVVARVDLAYPDVKLAIEYDGSLHFDHRRTLRDRQRDLELADLGWDTMRLGQDDLEARPQTVRRVTRRLESRGATL